MFGKQREPTGHYEQLVAFIEKHQTDFYRFVFLHIKNKEDTLDIIQDSIVKSLEKVYTLHKVESLKTWFFQILYHESINFLKRNSKVTCVEDEILDWEQEHRVENPKLDIVDKITLFDAVNQLDSATRSIIILRYYEDLKLGDIAKIVNTNENTVKTKLYKGIRQLEELLR